MLTLKLSNEEAFAVATAVGDYTNRHGQTTGNTRKGFKLDSLERVNACLQGHCHEVRQEARKPKQAPSVLGDLSRVPTERLIQALFGRIGK